jgi:hypothetical protein
MPLCYSCRSRAITNEGSGVSEETTTTTAGAPYTSWGSLENLVERMAKDGVPPRIDRSVVTGSEGQKTLMLNALRWLELTEDNGNSTATLEHIVKAADRQAEFGKLLREKYADQVVLGERNASQRELEDSFKPHTGETARKAASFYLKAAKYAGLPTSPYFKVPRQRRAKPGSGGGKTSAAKTGRAAGGGGASGGGGENHAGGIHPAVAGLLNDLPPIGSGWESTEARDAFLKTFETLVTYAIPVGVTSDTAPAASGDPDEDDDGWNDE